jgi:hypothetical protein
MPLRPSPFALFAKVPVHNIVLPPVLSTSGRAPPLRLEPEHFEDTEDRRRWPVPWGGVHLGTDEAVAKLVDLLEYGPWPSDGERLRAPP